MFGRTITFFKATLKNTNYVSVDGYTFVKVDKPCWSDCNKLMNIDQSKYEYHTKWKLINKRAKFREVTVTRRKGEKFEANNNEPEVNCFW